MKETTTPHIGKYSDSTSPLLSPQNLITQIWFPASDDGKHSLTTKVLQSHYKHKIVTVEIQSRTFNIFSYYCGPSCTGTYNVNG